MWQAMGRPWGQTEFQVNLKLGLTPYHSRPLTIRPLTIPLTIPLPFLTVLAVQLGRNIYVLHAFQKKSKKGIATPKPDVDLIK